MNDEEKLLKNIEEKIKKAAIRHFKQGYVKGYRAGKSESSSAAIHQWLLFFVNSYHNDFNKAPTDELGEAIGLVFGKLYREDTWDNRNFHSQEREIMVKFLRAAIQSDVLDKKIILGRLNRIKIDSKPEYNEDYKLFVEAILA